MPDPAWLPSLADFERRHPGWLPAGEPRRLPADWLSPVRQVELGRAHAAMLREPYAADRDRYGLADHWAIDPAGDCEDRALYAMQWLRMRHPAGWPRQSLWLYIVRGRRLWRRYAHAVAVIYLSDRVVLLDNLRATPELLDRPPDAAPQNGYDQWVRVTPELLIRTPSPSASPSTS